MKYYSIKTNQTELRNFIIANLDAELGEYFGIMFSKNHTILATNETQIADLFIRKFNAVEYEYTIIDFLNNTGEILGDYQLFDIQM